MNFEPTPFECQFFRGVTAKLQVRRRRVKDFSPEQERDEWGRWATSSGGVSRPSGEGKIQNGRMSLGSKGSYKEGSIIHAKIGGGSYHVRVESVEENVKNGYPGWSGKVEKIISTFPNDGTKVGEGKWGYNDQIVKVVKDAALSNPSL